MKNSVPDYDTNIEDLLWLKPEANWPNFTKDHRAQTLSKERLLNRECCLASFHLSKTMAQPTVQFVVTELTSFAHASQSSSASFFDSNEDQIQVWK